MPTQVHHKFGTRPGVINATMNKLFTPRKRKEKWEVAHLHRNFEIFHVHIAPTEYKKKLLLEARNTVRNRIRKYFQDTLQVTVPRFRTHGACAMDTLVDPLDCEYDIDDGVYLQHLDKQNDSAWPTAEAIQLWLMKATAGHGEEAPIPIAKKACVRVRHAGRYRVDLPSFAEVNGAFKLAVKGEPAWIVSNPPDLTDWFKSRVHCHGEQLRRLVRYLKAWADFQSMRLGQMPGGLLLTILTANHFRPDRRDDVALANTLDAIAKSVNAGMTVLNPADNCEELSARLTRPRISRFREAIQEFAADACDAVGLTDTHEATKIWRKQLGGRFSC
jgi:hypothetical protein